jgi:RND family efflux transporter MFP subunit
MQATKALVDKAEDSKTRENIDSAILNMTITLNSVYNDLKIVRDQCDQGTYFLSVSSTDKTSLDTQKTYINTALTSVTTAQQTISADKIALQKAEDNLAVEVAAPRPEDIDIYKSQIEQAQANVNSYQSQLNDNFIYSPIDGKVTAVNAKRGETVSYSESIINLLSTEPFQVKVDVYEQDIVNVDTGDPVKIDLVAFPKQTFEGKVLSIDPAEKIVDNVIYYQVTIEFPNQPAGVRSGMTADITIETDKKAGVLRVSKNAVQNIDGKYIVQVAESRKIIDKEVVIGLEGNDYYEIISGIKEGEMIVAGKK